jgi:hypothetical protein
MRGSVGKLGNGAFLSLPREDIETLFLNLKSVRVAKNESFHKANLSTKCTHHLELKVKFAEKQGNEVEFLVTIYQAGTL